MTAVLSIGNLRETRFSLATKVSLLPLGLGWGVRRSYIERVEPTGAPATLISCQSR